MNWSADILSAATKNPLPLGMGSVNDSIIMGDIYIGTGETDGAGLIAKAARRLQSNYPGIHHHISTGNANFVTERLDKGLLDFCIVFGTMDLTKYNALKLPRKDVVGILMRNDSPLAEKEGISPED